MIYCTNSICFYNYKTIPVLGKFKSTACHICILLCQQGGIFEHQLSYSWKENSLGYTALLPTGQLYPVVWPLVFVTFFILCTTMEYFRTLPISNLNLEVFLWEYWKLKDLPFIAWCFPRCGWPVCARFQTCRSRWTLREQQDKEGPQLGNVINPSSAEFSFLGKVPMPQWLPQ